MIIIFTVEQMQLAVGPYYNKLMAAGPNGPRSDIITLDITNWRGVEKIATTLVGFQQFVVKAVLEENFTIQPFDLVEINKHVF